MDTNSQQPQRSDERLAIGGTLAVIGAAVALWIGAGLLMTSLQRRLTPDPEREFRIALAALEQTPAGPMLDWDLHDWGKQQYLKSCTSCHAANGRGLPNLGKDLVLSGFVKDQPDDGLVKFLLKGRPTSDPLNTTKIDMPPKGGNPVLDEEDLACIVIYLRGLQDPRRVPPKPPEEADSAADSAASSAG